MRELHENLDGMERCGKTYQTLKPLMFRMNPPEQEMKQRDGFKSSAAALAFG
jgi:hypothetical protein